MYDELHVDGGTTRELFVLPVEAPLKAFDPLYAEAADPPLLHHQKWQGVAGAGSRQSDDAADRLAFHLNADQEPEPGRTLSHLPYRARRRRRFQLPVGPHFVRLQNQGNLRPQISSRALCRGHERRSPGDLAESATGANADHFAVFPAEDACSERASAFALGTDRQARANRASAGQTVSPREIKESGNDSKLGKPSAIDLAMMAGRLQEPARLPPVQKCRARYRARRSMRCRRRARSKPNR